MISTIALLILAQPVTPVRNPGRMDGGSLLNVYVAGQAAGAGGLTNTELRATPVLVDIYSDGGASAAGLTNSELRASPINVLVDGGSITAMQGTSPWVTSSIVTGSVSVNVSDGGITVNNFPTSTLVGGQVAVNISDGGIVVNNFPASQAVTGTFWQTTQPVSGNLAVYVADGGIVVNNFPASQVVTLASTTVTGQVAVNIADGGVAQAGTWTVQPGNTANTTPWLTTDTPRTVASANNTGTCTSVTASTTVLASNASRRAYGFKASDANTANVHCKLGATATTSNMTFAKGAGWSQDTGAVYTGVIDCIAASGTQSVCVYEVN